LNDGLLHHQSSLNWMSRMRSHRLNIPQTAILLFPVRKYELWRRPQRLQ
jgi:hypothetical protein